MNKAFINRTLVMRHTFRGNLKLLTKPLKTGGHKIHKPDQYTRLRFGIPAHPSLNMR